MKREWVGWMAKTEFNEIMQRWKWSKLGNARFRIDDLWRGRGAKKDYCDEDWPPVKLRLILEEVE